MTNAHSRYALATALLPSTKTAAVRSEFERLFERYGIPKAILSDNGSPFACTTAPAGLTELSAWWISLGIQVIRSRPGCPQDNGAHERFHLDVLPLQNAPALSRQAQQTLCDEWRREFNHVRPHQALAMKTPAQVYRPDRRRLAPKVARYDYPAGAVMRRVLANGHFWWQGRSFFLSRALRGHSVALVHKPGEALATILFHHLSLGQLDLENGCKVEPISDQDRHPAALTAA